MRAKYVGDAKDFAKAFLFKFLRDNDQVHHLKVLPFFTNDKRDSEDIRDAWQTYASILGCDDADILLGDRPFCNDPTQRDDYIADASRDAGNADTLFLDPDTGIRHELRAKKSAKYYVRNQEYVTYDELSRLLTVHVPRILIVYDEAYSRGPLEAVAKAMACKLESLRHHEGTAFGYYGNALNLAFLANHAGADRLANIQRILTDYLGVRRDRIIIP
jgi:hypothetical protein